MRVILSQVFFNILGRLIQNAFCSLIIFSMDLLLIQTNSKTTKQYTKTVENVSICGLELLTFVNCLVRSIDCYSHSSLVKKSFSKYLTSTTSTNAACTVLMDHEGLSLAGKLFSTQRYTQIQGISALECPRL
jgi:hypothetical protein